MPNLRTKVTKRKRWVGQIIGYLRVSSLDQKELRQLEGMTLDKCLVDKASSKDLHRPELEQTHQLRSRGRYGDLPFNGSAGPQPRRSAKSSPWFTDRGVYVRFARENLTFTGEDSPMSHLLLSVMGAFVKVERDLIRERQREGIALAKLREGAYVGRNIRSYPFRQGNCNGVWPPSSRKRPLPASWRLVVRPSTATLQEQGSEDQPSTGHALPVRVGKGLRLACLQPATR